MRQASHTKASRRVSPSNSGIDKTRRAWILDPFSGSATTGIAANLLNRRYLGLEIEDDFLAMSKARREEIEHHNIRCNYLERLRKAKIILPSDELFAVDEDDSFYGVPWLD